MARVRVTNGIGQFVNETERKIAGTITGVLMIGASNASVYTPIDTSTLLNSQYRRIDRTAKGFRGVVGYTANYAGQVHDPDVKQTFRRATAKKEFLKLGFDDSRDLIDEFVRKRMKTK